MNLKTSRSYKEAVLTFSFEKGMIAFTQSAQVLFAEVFQTDLKQGFFFNPDSQSIFSEICNKLENCRRGKSEELFYETSKFDICLNFTPVLDENGKFNLVSISIQTVSSGAIPENPNQIHLDQIHKKEIYTNLFYNNPDAVFSFDLEGNFVNANLSSALLAEISRDELLKMNFLPLIPEEDHEEVLNHFSRAKNGEVQNYQTNFRSIKGTPKILEITNFPIRRQGQIIGVYGIAKDITNQKETEKRIRDERQMLRAIIDNIPDYIFVKDREHKSILSNKKFYTQILGQENDDSSKGFSPLDYFDTKKGKKIIADNDMVMNHGQAVVNRPDIVTNINGEQEVVLLTKVPLKDQKEDIIGLVGIARDITETYLYNKKQDLTFKVIKAFGDQGSFQEAMVKTLSILCSDLGFDYAEAFKISIDNKKLVRSAFWPVEKDLSAQKNTFQKGERLPGLVWQSRKVEVLRKDDDPEVFEKMILNGASIKTAVGVPIIFQGKLISIFCLGSINDSKRIEVDVLSDINLQIASAIERKRSQDQLNDFYKYSPNLIAVVGMDGFLKKINPSFEEKFGFSNDEILTKPFTDFIHPEDLSRTQEAVENRTVGNLDFEIRCRKKNGEYLWISWRFSRFFEKENVVFVYGTDITPLKNVHKELSENIAKRKIIQQKLEDSEKKYRNLFDASPLPMWVLDREELKFMKVNRAALDLYGYSEEEFSAMTVRDLWAPEQEDDINKIIASNQNEFFQVKVRHVKKNGDLIYVNVNSSPLVFDGVKARVSLIKDVTARIEAEKLLHHSEQRFKALVQEGSDLISIVDCKYNYIYNSPASKTIFGLEASELNATNFLDYIHTGDIKKVKSHLSKLETMKRVQLPSYRIKGPKDNWRWIETIITNLKDEPAIEGIVMNSRDITEFVEQEQELLESLKRYDIVARATSDIITDYDIEKEIMQVSDAAFTLFGYETEDGKYSAKWWYDKIHPEDHDKVEAAADQMKKNNKKNLTIEYRFKCKDGSYKYILDRSYLISDEKNKPKRIIGSMQDITERKKHLIAIEDHNKRLKEIAWTQSHVVRAPLAKVMGLVDLLMNYRNDLDNIEELLENILNSANELDGIIRNIAVQTEKEL